MYKRLISLIVLTPLLAGLVHAQVIPTWTTALESYDMPGYFMVCTTTGNRAVRLVEGGDQTPEGQWRIVTGLQGAGTVSLTPVALVDYYLRHANWIIYCDPLAAANQWFMGDASWTPRPGLADPNDPTLVSFESQNYPGNYLNHNTSSPIGFGNGTIAAGNEGRATFRFPPYHPELATKPIPKDEVTDVPRDVVLQWTAGQYAGTHDVYFGTLFDDVNTASRAASQGVLASQGQTTTTFDPAGLLAWGQTYFWRIDEVNATADQTIFKGDVWSFTAEPYAYPITPIAATASGSFNTDTTPMKTIDASGMNGDVHSASFTDMWLSSKTPQPSWIQYEFDQVYTLHQMWVWNHNGEMELDMGYGAKAVAIDTSTDGTTWTALPNVPEFAQATAEPNYVHNTTVDFGGIAAKYVKLTIHTNWSDGAMPYSGLSEVRFFRVPTQAFGPEPASAATGVDIDTTLNWRPGRDAVLHEVYFGTDPDALVLSKTVTEHQLALTALGAEYGRTYYWKVNEVNDAATPPLWEGGVWSFSTLVYKTVDDFESYNDECNRVYYAWKSGASNGENAVCGVSAYSGNGTGSVVGNNDPPYAERANVHSGSQAMPFSYDNTAGSGVSEAVRTFSPAQDWTVGGLKTLVLFFKGQFANGAGQVYVKINGTQVSYDGNANALTRDLWTQWNIDLSSLSVKAVSTLTIGVSGTGKGVLYVDDIQLYRVAPAVATEQLYIEAESVTPMPAPWTLSDDVLASGGKYITTPSTATASSAAPPTTGMLTYSFTVRGGVYRLWFRTGPILGGGNDSLWVRIQDATISPAGNAANPGWVRANNLSAQAGMSTWHWVAVWDDDNADVQTRFTLSAGTHTLEIGYRELAVPLDAILIADN